MSSGTSASCSGVFQSSGEALIVLDLNMAPRYSRVQRSSETRFFFEEQLVLLGIRRLLSGHPGEVTAPPGVPPDEGLALGEAVGLDAAGWAEEHAEGHVCASARGLDFRRDRWTRWVPGTSGQPGLVGGGS